VWVEGGDIHDELLDQLGTVLTVPEDLALTPSAAEFEALAAAVAARWPEGASAPGPGPSSVQPLRQAGPRPLRRIGSSAWRAGSVAAAIVLFSASAAAAAGGVPLPRPVRVVAYTVGLPVDSPALDDTNHHIKELKDAVKANDKPKAEATARRLQTDLTKVPAQEKKAAQQKVEAVLIQAAPLVQSPAPTTATTSAPASPSTTAPAPASSTTATTAAADDKEKGSGSTTTTTAPPTTTTTAPDPTTTTSVPAGQTGGTPSDPGTTTGDPGAGGAGTGGGDPGSTTPTTAPDSGTTTTTTAPGGGTPGGDPTTSTTTTTSTSTTTTTTMPPADGGAPPQ
jgi:hypothetical protein